jgi:hypothetical protein
MALDMIMVGTQPQVNDMIDFCVMGVIMVTSDGNDLISIRNKLITIRVAYRF